MQSKTPAPQSWGRGFSLKLYRAGPGPRRNPWRQDRLQTFLAGLGDIHACMLLIAAGWAFVRLQRLPCAESE